MGRALPVLAAVALGALASAGAPAPARAEVPPPGAAGEGSEFWERIALPGRARYRLLVAEADMILRSAAAGARAQERALAAEALARAAIAIAPDAFAGHRILGLALSELGRTDESIAAHREALARAASPQEEYLAHGVLGVELTRARRYREAHEHYRRALPHAPGDESRSTTLSNDAETLMHLGRVGEAIDAFRRALAVAPGNLHALWGLAVALDRDEQIAQARETARTAAARDPELRHIHGSDFFFAPPSEVHYYDGLAHEARGDPVRALESWRRYLIELPDSPWAHRARVHAEEAERASAPAARRAPSRPVRRAP